MEKEPLPNKIEKIDDWLRQLEASGIDDSTKNFLIMLLNSSYDTTDPVTQETIPSHLVFLRQLAIFIKNHHPNIFKSRSTQISLTEAEQEISDLYYRLWAER